MVPLSLWASFIVFSLIHPTPLSLKQDKARFSKERMDEIMKMHPHGFRHGDHVHGDVRPNGGGDRM